MDTQTYSDILELLHREVKPALGCTEPIAVALAVAKACAQHRPLKPSQIRVQVSANILKNAMGVGIPGTGMVGLNIAVSPWPWPWSAATRTTVWRCSRT